MTPEFREVYEEAGRVGIRQQTKPELADYIRGYTDTDDAGFGLRMLISQHNYQKGLLPFKVGDKVRVRKKYWYLGARENGWSGYAPMFADATAKVTSVEWSIHSECWYLTAKYANPYRYIDALRGGEFVVKDRPVSFMFNLGDVKKVKRKEKKCC